MTPDTPSALAWVLGAAVVIDLTVGELPAPVHPVVWMGRVTEVLTRPAHRYGPHAQRVWGAVWAVLVPTTFAVAASVALAVVEPWPAMWFAVATALLGSTFSVRGLARAGGRVRRALASEELGSARHGLRSLCSRDARTLGRAGIAAATIESLAENTSDSVVGPLLFFALLGIPGAIFYRVVNTMDAMIGYRDGYEHLGKAAARLDDLLNFVPARITGLGLLAAGGTIGKKAARGWQVMWRDGGRTASPNAGVPMAAMAGVLGVQLDKAGCYRLGDATDPLSTARIAEAERIVYITSVSWTAVVTTAMGTLGHGAT